MTKKVRTPKVPVPRSNHLGTRRNPKGFGAMPRAPRPKSTNSRVYTKAVLRQDPSEFTDFGFGNTGLTGES